MNDDRAILSPGDTIGILGGGQLARMLAMAAASFGLRTHIYAPEPESPAFDVAATHTTGRYDDETALAGFACAVDVVTYEFENVPAATIAAITPFCPVRPNGRALEITQDRLFEKTFLRELGLPTASFAAIDRADDLASALDLIGRPALLKTRRLGYDGKGQLAIRHDTATPGLFESLGQPAILEAFVPFSCEVSVIAARGQDGAFRPFDLCENEHAHHILAATRVPARQAHGVIDAANAIAKRIADALDYVGVLAVEMFVLPVDGRDTLVINEIAPRVHNSGHWTLDGAVTSQFAQHIRAICGWPLGSTRRHGTIEMRNLIGDEADSWLARLGQDGACLHLYGKSEARAGRKMGHVTTVTPFPTG